MNQRALLQTALWAATVPKTLPALLPQSEGAKPCTCRLGHTVTEDLGMLTYALMPSHPKLVLLAPYGTWHPGRAEFGRAVCQLGTGSRPLPCMTCLCWDMVRDGLLIEGYFY